MAIAFDLKFVSNPVIYNGRDNLITSSCGQKWGKTLFYWSILTEWNNEIYSFIFDKSQAISCYQLYKQKLQLAFWVQI